MVDSENPTWNVSKKLRANARELRKKSTDAERLLWSELRDHRLNGIGFRRQVPIKNYITDFACHSAKLVGRNDRFTASVQQAAASVAPRRTPEHLI